MITPSQRRTSLAVIICFLIGISSCAKKGSISEVQIGTIPKDFKTVTFSQDAKHVAFGVENDGKFRAIVDGKEGPPYEDITVVEYSPQANHFYYGGKREGKWYLVRDGKETAELDGLTSLTQGTGLHYIGEKITVTMWNTLAIWFAEKADNYLVLCYVGHTGKIFKDGSWLPVEFESFWHRGMAFSPDGKHYSFAVTPLGSDRPPEYIDGIPGPRFDNIDGATYLQPGNRLMYRGQSNSVWTLMEGKEAVQGYGPLAGDIKVSKDDMHLAALVQKEGGKQAVVVDGKEETAFPRINWGFTGWFSVQSSFVWNKDYTSHAYVAYLTDEKQSPMAVILDGKPTQALSEIRGSSLSISDDRKHVAYAAKDQDKWSVVVDEVAQERFEEVSDPVLTGPEAKVVYGAKSSKGWAIKGLSDTTFFSELGPLVRGPNNEVAYAAKIGDGKWQVFLNERPISRPFDNIVGQTGLEFESSGSLRFVAKDGDKLVLVKGN